jgi:ATP-dependent helicase/nuclease subunit B
MNPDPREKRGREVVFLLGPAGSGKTRRCLDRLLECEAAGEAAYFLVPEQSTYLADRQMLEPPGPDAVRHVRVVSFRRLALLLEDPGIAPRTRTLDRSGRRILLRALFARLEPSLRRPFEAVADRPGFLESLVSVLREIRDQSGVEGSVWLDSLGGRSDVPDDLRAKLATLSALRRAYEEALTARGLRDPELLLLDTPGKILSHEAIFRGRTVLIDGFMSFTKLETEIIAALAQVGADLTIALCLDPALAELAAEVAPPPPRCRIDEWPRGFLARVDRPVFLAPLRTFAEVRARIHAGGFPTSTERLDGPLPRFRSPGIARIEAGIIRRRLPRTGGTSTDVALLAARDPAHEVEIWAGWIDRWIRLEKKPVRPGEIAVIVRDLETYRPLVEETFARYRIPVFIDRHWDISSRPLVRTILDALEVLNSEWQRQAVVAFLRSPCLDARGGEIDILENLAIEAGYDYGQWTEGEWPALRRPPRARYLRGGEREAKGEPDEAIEEETEPAIPAEGSSEGIEDEIERVRAGIANRIRATHLGPLKPLEAQLASGRLDGPAAVTALREWVVAAGIRGHVAGPDGEREIEAVDHVLDQISQEAAGESLSIEAFTRLLLAGLGSLRLGRTPTRPDAVILAEVQRSRLGEVRRAIVGGLSVRDFPRTVASDRFFTEGERAALGRMGLDLGAPDPLRQEEEAYFLYIALTRAAEHLVLTRPTTDIEGNPLDPSPFIEEIRAASPGLVEITPRIEERPSDLDEAQTAEQLAARVGAYIASRLDRRRAGRGQEPDMESARPDDRRILTLYNRLVAPPPGLVDQAPLLIEEAGRLWGYENRPRLHPRVVAAAMTGRSLATSVGRLESFARCPYQHFARHMLRLAPRPEAKVTPLENGLLTHTALEILMKEGPLTTDRREIERRLAGVFESIRNRPELHAFDVATGGRFRWRNTRGRLLRFLEIEARRIEASDFRPAEFERDFGTLRTRPLRIPLSEGGELLLRGRIDRIDVAETGGRKEALVLDYKSGQLADRGRPIDVRRGLDLQLAVYLLVVEEVLGMDPFGALYAQVLPKPVSGESNDPENPLDIKLIGLVPTDEWSRATGGHKFLKGSQQPLKTREDLSRLLQEARGTLILYAEALLRGMVDVAPVKIGSKSPCDACDFASLCRVDEMYNPFRESPKDGLSEQEEQP